MQQDQLCCAGPFARNPHVKGKRFPPHRHLGGTRLGDVGVARANEDHPEMPVNDRVAHPGLLRVILSFALGGFALNVAVVMGWTTAGLVWTDLLHDNPYRTVSNAITMMALSPLYGLLYAVLGSELPLITATIIAVVSWGFWRRVPIASLLLMLPLCIYAMHLQGQFIPRILSEADYPPFDLSQALFLARQQLPVLLGCWWICRPNHRRVDLTSVF